MEDEKKITSKLVEYKNININGGKVIGGLNLNDITNQLTNTAGAVQKKIAQGTTSLNENINSLTTNPDDALFSNTPNTKTETKLKLRGWIKLSIYITLVIFSVHLFIGIYLWAFDYKAEIPVYNFKGITNKIIPVRKLFFNLKYIRTPGRILKPFIDVLKFLLE